jgi:hypothetical protein
LSQITQNDEEESRIGTRRDYDDEKNEKNEKNEKINESNEMPKRGKKPKKDIQIFTNAPPPGWGLKWKRITSNSFLSLRKSKHSPIVQFIILCILNQNYTKVWSNLFKFYNNIDKIKQNLEKIEQDIFSKAKNKKSRFKRFTAHNTKPKRRVGRPTKEERMDLSSDDEYIEPSERKKKYFGLKLNQSNNEENSSKMEIELDQPKTDSNPSQTISNIMTDQLDDPINPAFLSPVNIPPPGTLLDPTVHQNQNMKLSYRSRALVKTTVTTRSTTLAKTLDQKVASDEAIANKLDNVLAITQGRLISKVKEDLDKYVSGQSDKNELAIIDQEYFERYFSKLDIQNDVFCEFRTAIIELISVTLIPSLCSFYKTSYSLPPSSIINRSMVPSPVQTNPDLVDNNSPQTRQISHLTGSTTVSATTNQKLSKAREEKQQLGEKCAPKSLNKTQSPPRTLEQPQIPGQSPKLITELQSFPQPVQTAPLFVAPATSLQPPYHGLAPSFPPSQPQQQPQPQQTQQPNFIPPMQTSQPFYPPFYPHQYPAFQPIPYPIPPQYGYPTAYPYAPPPPPPSQNPFNGKQPQPAPIGYPAQVYQQHPGAMVPSFPSLPHQQYAGNRAMPQGQNGFGIQPIHSHLINEPHRDRDRNQAPL